MNKDDDRSGELQRLTALVETYGGNRDRWPAAERLQMARLIASDTAAAACLADAQALDRVLDHAPALSSDRLAALQSRVLATAAAEGRWKGDAAEPQSPPEHGKCARDESSASVHPGAMVSRSSGASAWFSSAARTPMHSAAMLAASFFIGILAGATVLSGDVIPIGSAAVAAVEVNDGGMLQQLGVGDDGLDAVEEDLL